MEPEWGKLREKFSQDLITKVQKRGGMYDTVNHAVVTDRLIRHGGDWTYSKPEPVTVIGGDGMPHVVAIVASMTIGGVTRWETGGPERMSNYTQELKESISDFIKRAAMRFGVALDLWTKEDLDGVVDATEGYAEATPSGPSEGVEARQVPEAIGEGVTGSEGTSAPSDAQRFITGREANALQKALSGRALEIAQARYGEDIQKLTDLTWGQATELVTKETVS